MNDVRWVGKHIEITPPKHPKKLTATRLGTVLGRNPWSTDFEVWCAITRTYEKPFEDTIYTLAGKAIEPLQIEYMRDAYIMDNLRSPTDLYGEDYFKKMRGDFFPGMKIFGGMWDSLLMDENNEPEAVLEFKTTKRVEDWQDDVPEYYAIQAALYAYLLGVDDVIMVASFLEQADYSHPEQYKPTASNTITVEFKVSERYPNFGEMIKIAKRWWKDHVETGISPDYDERKDAEILAALRTNYLSPDTDIDALVQEAEGLKAEVDAAAAAVAEKEKRLKKITNTIKEYAAEQFRPGDKKVEVRGSRYVWTLAKSEKTTTKIDEDKLKEAGLYELYANTVTDTSYRMTVSAVKED